jgi:hypothetical protein
VRRLRRDCERRLAGVPVPSPFDLDEFCQGVARVRGRRLRLQGLPGLSAQAPCGMWLALPSADYILFDSDTSPLHAEHIVLHEVGHILCNHSISADIDNSMLSRLMPDLDPRAVARVLGRVQYPTEQEQEAEMIASLIRARADRVSRDRRPDPLGRLADALTFEP